MTKKQLNILRSNGWLEIKDITFNNDFASYASKFGKPVLHPNEELINVLKPNNGNSRIGSFSTKFGFGSFPLHTDTAFLGKPIRYILLSSYTPSKTNTIFYNSKDLLSTLSSDELKDIKRAIYVVKTKHSQHYTSIIFNKNKINGFRYDPCCMIPINESAKRINSILKNLSDLITPNKISWTGNNLLILDNWKMLHGRAKVVDEKNRKINRIYIDQL